MGEVIYSSRLAKRHADTYQELCKSVGFEEAKRRMKTLLGDTDWWKQLVQEIKRRVGK